MESSKCLHRHRLSIQSIPISVKKRCARVSANRRCSGVCPRRPRHHLIRMPTPQTPAVHNSSKVTYQIPPPNVHIRIYIDKKKHSIQALLYFAQGIRLAVDVAAAYIDTTAQRSRRPGPIWSGPRCRACQADAKVRLISPSPSSSDMCHANPSQCKEISGCNVHRCLDGQSFIGSTIFTYQSAQSSCAAVLNWSPNPQSDELPSHV